MAAFLPIYWDSNDMVIIPTNVRVDIRAATWGYPALFWSNIFPVENATKVGISTIEPINAESNIPRNPELLPINLEIVEGSTIARMIPTIIIIPKNCGIIFSKEVIDIFSEWIVFFLSFRKDIINNTSDRVYKIIAVIIPQL